MTEFDPELLKKLYKPARDSHKGENGKVMIIAGSKLFHAASIWPLTVASRIVDMVFYSSVETNNNIVESIKSEFRDGIIVPRNRVEDYIQEADAILIGPGLPRGEGVEEGDDDTRALTERLLNEYPDKKWVIDGGSLQTINPEVLLNLKTMPILTPHRREFEKLFNTKYEIQNTKYLSELAQKYNCIILLKGEEDIITSPTEQVVIAGGNAGMTKGGTGDVLAGLVVALYAKNDAFLSAVTASYINKKAGESLEKKMGIYFNGTDLANEIPSIMKELI
ncbi:MAG TPA: NAD(P)H-hydrate dehydratase [Patescibacteria group bacterium]|nr:NAD(P)H-hydrate dehydratase [Patescibacteria group bacterium]